MKKNRNSFFTENSSNFQSYNPMMQNPYQMQSNNYMAYSGNMPNMNNMNIQNDWNERLAKIERQITRLDHRVSVLENNNVKLSDDIDSSNNNMYMI